MDKQRGAFLTIGELAAELNVPQHILRYWETRFPGLRPLQRAGNRRYYRSEDVELARRIHHLLNVEGYTVRGAQQVLEGKADAAERVADAPNGKIAVSAPVLRVENSEPDRLLSRLQMIRDRLEAALS